MKIKTLLIFLTISTSTFGQNQKAVTVQRIQFLYDTAGNQIQRYLCVSGTCASKHASYETEKSVTEDKMIEEDKVLFYPNPVLEELYIKWKNKEDRVLVSIDIYAMTGQKLKSITDVNSIETIKLSFGDYPLGYYNVLLVYSNGDKKDLKIVK